MKLRHIVLSFSVLANGALLWAMVVRNSAPSQTQLAAPAPVRAATASQSPPRPDPWRQLISANPATYAANLRAAGLPEEFVQEIIRAEIDTEFAARFRRLAADLDQLPFWKSDAVKSVYTSKYFDLYKQLQRERAQGILAVSSPQSASGPTGTLSPAKLDIVKRIEDDYRAMNGDLSERISGITLPGDEQQFALLEKEKRADLARILTPEELKAYEATNSPLVARLRTALTLMDASEAEFQKIQSVYSDYDAVINPPGGVTNAEAADRRKAAQSELAQRLRAELGEARFAEFVRTSTSEYRQLALLAERENLPATAARDAFDVRARVSTESNRIAGDASLSPAQKRTAMQSLAQDARGQIVASLGPNLGNSYLQVANRWLANVERGSAVTFGPENATAYRRVAGNNPPKK